MTDSKIVKGSKVLYKDDPDFTPLLEVERFYYLDNDCWVVCKDDDGDLWEFTLEHLCLASDVVRSKPEEDVVNQPTHYARWLIEPITYIMRNGFEFWRGNIVKYASRAGFKLYPGKDAVESEIIDLEKVIRYAQMRINQLNGEEVL